MTVDHGDNSPNIKNPLAISVPLVLFGEKSRVRLKKKKKNNKTEKKKKRISFPNNRTRRMLSLHPLALPLPPRT